MYKTIIEFKNGLTEEKINELVNLCNKAFDNRAGKAIGMTEKQNHISFEGGENLYGCLRLGTFAAYNISGFIQYLKSWIWIEEDPDECCDMLELFAKHKG